MRAPECYIDIFPRTHAEFNKEGRTILEMDPQKSHTRERTGTGTSTGIDTGRELLTPQQYMRRFRDYYFGTFLPEDNPGATVPMRHRSDTDDKEDDPNCLVRKDF